MNCASAVRSIYIDKMIFIHGCHMISKILTHPIDMKLRFSNFFTNKN